MKVKDCTCGKKLTTRDLRFEGYQNWEVSGEVTVQMLGTCKYCKSTMVMRSTKRKEIKSSKKLPTAISEDKLYEFNESCKAGA